MIETVVAFISFAALVLIWAMAPAQPAPAASEAPAAAPKAREVLA